MVLETRENLHVNNVGMKNLGLHHDDSQWLATKKIVSQLRVVVVKLVDINQDLIIVIGTVKFLPDRFLRLPVGILDTAILKDALEKSF